MTPFATAADAIRAARPGVTDRDIARALGVSHVTASYWRTGSRTRGGISEVAQPPSAVMQLVTLWAATPELFDCAAPTPRKRA